MGHDAKVSLKHYAQTTEDHFDRATSGAESGARAAQNQAQQTDAGHGGVSHERSASPEPVASYAIPGDMCTNAANGWNGEGGIRTLERLAPLPVFETGAFGHSATSPR